MQPLLVPNPTAAVKVVLWKDVFVIIDDGSARASDYGPVIRRIEQLNRKYSGGLGCLVIIPANATPPPEDVRRMLNAVLDGISLKCLCWLVEGSGFQGAMVRAVLTGLRLFSRRKYPTSVESDVEPAIVWILPHLEGGQTRLSEAAAAIKSIRSQREEGRFVRSS
jgi:hypothetical protein